MFVPNKTGNDRHRPRGTTGKMRRTATKMHNGSIGKPSACDGPTAMAARLVRHHGDGPDRALPRVGHSFIAQQSCASEDGKHCLPTGKTLLSSSVPGVGHIPVVRTHKQSVAQHSFATRNVYKSVAAKWQPKCNNNIAKCIAFASYSLRNRTVSKGGFEC